MILSQSRYYLLTILLFVWAGGSVFAQPTLPDLTGNSEKGLVLLSWTCQYDGVKSIAVLRSTDSTFNYSTIGYVRKLYKGVQAFADGHPMPGKNFYKLSIVFNSGLTWGSNHYGVYVDSDALRNTRLMPSNEALQKLIVTEQSNKVIKTEIPKPRKNAAPADKDKYMEILRKDTVVAAPTPPPLIPNLNLKENDNEDLDISSYVEGLPEETRKKITIVYQIDYENVDPTAYLQENKAPEQLKPTEQKQKVSVTFEDKADVTAFVESLPKSQEKKITISYNIDSADLDPQAYLNEDRQPDTQKKKISLTFKDEAEVHAYVESIPKLAHSKITVSYSIDSSSLNAKAKPLTIVPPVNRNEPEKQPEAPPKPKISIKFDNEPTVNSSTAVKSKYIFSDPVSGHVKMYLPDDIAAHHYSVKFYDKENHIIIDIPKINTAKIIIDKRNFQKKGMYKFTLRKDILELETGYVNIY